MLSEKMTTVTLPTRTLRALHQYKGPGMSLADVIEELMADNPPDSFWAELERRESEPTISEKELYQRMGWK